MDCLSLFFYLFTYLFLQLGPTLRWAKLNISFQSLSFPCFQLIYFLLCDDYWTPSFVFFPASMIKGSVPRSKVLLYVGCFFESFLCTFSFRVGITPWKAVRSIHHWFSAYTSGSVNTSVKTLLIKGGTGHGTEQAIKNVLHRHTSWAYFFFVLSHFSHFYYKVKRPGLFLEISDPKPFLTSSCITGVRTV